MSQTLEKVRLNGATPSSHGATAQIAAFVSGAAFEALPPAVVERARMSFLDTLGIALAGAAEPGGVIITRYAVEGGGPPQASIVGTARKVSPRSAAAANGTLAHIVGFSDFSVPNVMHPSVAVLPAVWALGEARSASGAQALLAHVVGVEVACKIARILTPAFTERGFHPCAVVGTFGAAAAAAKLAGLDTAQTANALGIAAVRAAGLKVSLGTMSKAYAVGHAAEGGVVAAELAALGFTGSDEALEGRDGFFETFGAGVSAAGLGSALGAPYEFDRPGITIKPYPACTRSHPAIDAALEIVRRDRPPATDIVSVECLVAPRVMQVVNVANPRNAMEAKFSLPFCLAAALTDGEVIIETFSDERLCAPAIQALMRKVEPRNDPALDKCGPFAAKVVVRMKDGKACVASRNRNLWDDPLADESEKRRQLLAKFRSCAARLLDAGAVEEVIGIVDNLEDEPGLDRLMSILRERRMPRP